MTVDIYFVFRQKTASKRSFCWVKISVAWTLTI